MAIAMATERISAIIMRMTIVIGVVAGRKMAARERYVQKSVDAIEIHEVYYSHHKVSPNLNS